MKTRIHFLACISLALLFPYQCNAELLLFTTVVNPTPNQTFFSRTVENILNDFFSEDDAVVAVTNRASHPNGTLTEFSVSIDASVYHVAAALRDGVLNEVPNGFNFLEIPRPVHAPLDSICTSEVVPLFDVRTSFLAEEFNTEVTCKNSFVVVKLNACNVTTVGINPLNLVLGPIDNEVDTVCKPILVENDDGGLDVVFLHTFTQPCGVTSEHDAGNDTIIFTLDIQSNEFNSESSIIQRFRAFCITVKCRYNDDDNIDLDLEPDLRKLELDETSGSGDFTFEVSLCLTEDCSLPLQPGSVVTLPDFIYVVANLSLVEDEDIVVEAEYCFATPSRNPNDPRRLDFIVNSCTAPDSEGGIVIFVNGDNRYFEFRFTSFVWTGYENETIYVYCNVVLCYNVTGECFPTECPSGVEKRSIRSHSKQFISFPHVIATTSCDNTHYCEHYCKLKNGIPTCDCKSGYILGNDGVSCTRQKREEELPSIMVGKRDAVSSDEAEPITVVMLSEPKDGNLSLVALGVLVGFLMFLMFVIITRVNSMTNKPNSSAVFL